MRYRYELTDKGRGLEEVLAALARWGKKYIPGTVVPTEFHKWTAGCPEQGPEHSIGTMHPGGRTTALGC